MELKLIRVKHRGESIDGFLEIDGERLCDTAENAITALPPGTYTIVRTFCKQYDRFVPLVLTEGSKVQRAKSSNHPDGNLEPLNGEAIELLNSRCSSCQKVKGTGNNTTLPMYCPQLKMGNGIHNRDDGSILLGTTIIPGCLKLPREPYEILSERLRKLSARGTEVTLTIH